MTYPYSAVNRFDEPHNYMYTAFQGVSLLESYLASRRMVIDRPLSSNQFEPELDREMFDAAKLALEHSRLSVDRPRNQAAPLPGDEAGPQEDLRNLADTLGSMSTEDTVATEDLVRGLVAAQLTGTRNAETKQWLDRVVQRFEVTKKLYLRYQPGFRKGEGDVKIVRVYWLFSLALSLFHNQNGSLKFLSTHLKVNDLLCSLPQDCLSGEIPIGGLSLVLLAEINSVKIVADQQGLKPIHE